MKVFLLFFMIVFFFSCNSYELLIEAPKGKEVFLSNESEGCKLKTDKFAWYWGWGAVGEYSTVDMLTDVSNPVRIEMKNTVGSVTASIIPCLIGFVAKTVEVYECEE